MKRILLLSPLLIVTTWAPGTSFAQSPFEGTWKLDVSSIQQPENRKPEVLLLEGGVYECKSCPWKGNADGTDQPVIGVPTFNSAAINVRDDHTIDLTFKKDGKVVMTNHMVVSNDGQLDEDTVEMIDKNGGSPRILKYVAKRISKGPAGSHLISGTWAPSKLEGMSDNMTTWTYRFNGDELTETTAGGESFTARLNGPEAPMKNNPEVTTVSVKMLDDRTLQETDMRDGKAVTVYTLILSDDHKTAKSKIEDKTDNTTIEATAVKQ